VVETGRPVVVPRISHEPLFLNRTGVLKKTGRDEVTFVCVPITADTRTVGALGVTLPYEKESTYDGEAKFFGNLRPSFDFALGEQKVSIFGRYEWVGKRYVDLFNRTAMPGYQTIGGGASLDWGAWHFQVVGDNLFNAHGLTEGNTRTDQFAGQGTSEAIYGRPLFGRNFRFIVSRSW